MTEALKLLNIKRGALKRQLSTFSTFVQNCTTDTDQLLERLEKISDIWRRFEEINVEIENLLEGSDAETLREHIESAESYECKYYEALTQAKQKLYATQKLPEREPPLVQSQRHTEMVKMVLPPLTIQPFSGKYENWLSFKDAFTKAVHEQEIPNVQKFQILRGLLKEDALNVVSALEATDANYSEAWKLLENRYANVRIITNTHMKGLFELPTISKAHQTNLRALVDCVRTHIRSLMSLGQPVGQWDTILIYLLTNKLDNPTKEEWEREIGKTSDDSNPTLEEFLKFLERRCLIFEMVDRGKAKPENPQTTSTIKKEKKVALPTTTSSPTSLSCKLCNKQHLIYKCDKFLALSTDAKIEEVKKLKLCFNCLKSGHQSTNCKLSSCRKCGRRHNTLLHKEAVVADTPTSSEPSSSNPVVTHCLPKDTTRIILSTARVLVNDVEGVWHECRALLDPGSQVNLLTENFVKKLKLECNHVNMPISGVQQSPLRVKKEARIIIKSAVSGFSEEQACLILPSITERLPQVSLRSPLLLVPPGIHLADPGFQEPGPVDLLIGAGLFWKLLIPGENIANKNQPSFQNTKLGWIVGGEFGHSGASPQVSCYLVTTSTLHRQIEKFWKLEEVDVNKNEYDQAEYCETHFRRTHARDVEGRFEVELPQDSKVLLGDSYKEAVRRLQGLERRFDKQPNLKTEYTKFLADYEAAGHMSLRKANQQIPNLHYYIPHQPVFRLSSLTTKIRVVFDASVKTYLGTSLNDRLMTGPNLQNDIFAILLRFRCYEYVVTADITQMFRQVQVTEKDRNLQLILWREDPKKPIQIFTLNTVTYGTNSAPFLAMRCLKQLANEARATSPEAASVIDQDFYMDDLLSGKRTLQEAIQLQQQLTEILKSGKFHLRKWRTNDPRVLQHLEASGTTDELLTLDHGDSIKTLGLLWNSKEDILLYRIQSNEDNKLSKRKILSAIAQIYDPLGLIGPIIITAKMIMQELWRLKVSWDEKVPLDLERTWTIFLKSLVHLQHLKVPRNVQPKTQDEKIILHGFCDASEKAYGACVYVVSVDDTGNFNSNLLCSKSRVAPLKKLTLPRLELCATLLLSRLTSIITKSLRSDMQAVHLWSDSTISLSWIMLPANRRTFEARRVAEIRTLTSGYHWRHVPSKDNPADLISRGVNTQKLISNSLWWHGPDWISSPHEWPPVIVETPTDPFQNQVNVAARPFKMELLQRFSKFNKLLRIVAYCFRFRNKLRRQHCGGPLTVGELEEARIRILIWVQAEAFPGEMTSLHSGKSIKPGSTLSSLNPFIDKDNLLKVGGRLRHANITEEQKHPVILPSKHHVTELILRDEHLRLMHCGPQQLLHSIRQRYWPISGGREARKVTKRCVECFRIRPTVPDIIMGDLPQARVTVPDHPFQTTGIDYAGPIQIRESRRRGRIHISKGYIAVFTCFSTKAVHLELVTDLTTETFLAALRRFVARRGLCTSIHSDNATNFVGAARELKEIYEFLNLQQDEITTNLAGRGIKWNFIPPRSPHFGGLWESAVKSVKRHLYTVTKGLVYTFEEYYTLLTEIEAILNSRPLMPLSSDPNDLSILTPAHFLIGTSLVEPGTRCYRDIPDSRLSRWQHTQKIKQHFWNRWKSDYLQHLQGRSKWKTGSSNLKIGSMVLLADDNQPPLHWNLGRIVKLIPGEDGISRVADVRTTHGLFKRSLKKLCILPFDT